MENDIDQLEDEIRAAQLAGDTRFFEELLDDDFKFVTPQGHVVTKRQDISQYESGFLKMKAVEISDRAVHVVGSTAIARSRVRFEGKAGPHTFSSRFQMTRIYSKDSGRWKLVAGQSYPAN